MLSRPPAQRPVHGPLCSPNSMIAFFVMMYVMVGSVFIMELRPGNTGDMGDTGA